MRKYYQLIVICILLLIIVLQRECTPKPEPCPDTSATVDTITTIDTVRIKGRTVYLPEPYSVIDTLIITTNIDTNAILKDYLVTRSYNLPIKQDSIADLIVKLSIHKNKIWDWSYDGKIVKYTKVIEHTTVIKEQPRTKFYAGLAAGYNMAENQPVLAPTIALNTKRDRLYQIQYEPINKVVSVGVLWKIGKK